MSYVIALTGGICSGKTTVAKFFSNFPGVAIIDSDIITRNIIQTKSSILLEITKYFGPKILLPNGSLNKHVLKQRIFFNSVDKKWLENLLHPLIQQETQKKINKLKYKSLYILWVTPLLIENNLQNQAHRVLVVDTHPDIQLNRIINRDKIDKQYAKQILLNQSTRQHRLNYAHDIINNDDIYCIRSQILLLHTYYTNKTTNNI